MRQNNSDSEKVLSGHSDRKPAISRWPLALVVLGLILLIGYIWTLRTARDAAQGVGQIVSRVGSRIDGLAEKFRTGRITTTFQAAIPELSSSQGGLLEVATAQVTETFRRSDERKIFWDLISLGETVSEIRVPVTYRYHLRLSDPWRLEVSGQTCVVHAPIIRPSIPPAIHTDGMEKKTERGWLRFDSDRQMAELERSITPTLQAYASDARHLNLVRDTCRKTVAEFVQSWLLKEDHWRTDRFRAVIVIFDDEGPVSLPSLSPTIQLEN